MKSKILNVDEVEAKAVRFGITRILIDSENSRAENLVVRLTEMLPGQVHESHAHKNEEVIFILSGKGTHTEEQACVHFGTNDVIYIPVGAMHRHECTGSEPLKMLVIFATSKKQ